LTTNPAPNEINENSHNHKNHKVREKINQVNQYLLHHMDKPIKRVTKGIDQSIPKTTHISITCSIRLLNTEVNGRKVNLLLIILILIFVNFPFRNDFRKPCSNLEDLF